MIKPWCIEHAFGCRSRHPRAGLLIKTNANRSTPRPRRRVRRLGDLQLDRRLKRLDDQEVRPQPASIPQCQDEHRQPYLYRRRPCYLKTYAMHSPISDAEGAHEVWAESWGPRTTHNIIHIRSRSQQQSASRLRLALGYCRNGYTLNRNPGSPWPKQPRMSSVSKSLSAVGFAAGSCHAPSAARSPP